MYLVVNINQQVTLYDLDALATTYSGVISIGQKCKNVWNAIALDDASVDPFQCNIIGTTSGPFRLNHGQNRTECPKGLLSSCLIPCNGCMGRCVNISVGKPMYSQRNPVSPTLINGAPVSKWGSYLKAGDVLKLGDIEVLVK